MTALTLADWRRHLVEMADLSGVSLDGVSPRGLASQLKREYDRRCEARLDDDPNDFRINGITPDETPQKAVRNILKQVAANQLAAQQRLTA